MYIFKNTYIYIHVWKNKKRGVISPRTSTLACVYHLKSDLKEKDKAKINREVGRDRRAVTLIMLEEQLTV